MMWAAYYQCDGEMRYTIAVCKLEHRAAFEADKFVNRLRSHGEPVEVCWVWVEETDENEIDSDPH